MSDDFYVGYLANTAPQLAKHLRRTAVVLIALFACIAVLLVKTMDGFSAAVFEYGVEREFEGVLVEGPCPAVVIERPGTAQGVPSTSSYSLVAFGKFGASDAVKGRGGERVRLKGTLIYRDDQTIIELVAGSIQVVREPENSGGPGAQEDEEDLGIHTFTGEIVDSKCFLGVMKPGNLKPHRACAVRCISGGIPPVLLVRDEQGLATYFHLLSEDGEAVNAQVLDRVAEPVEIEGRVIRRGQRSFLMADPATYQGVL